MDGLKRGKWLWIFGLLILLVSYVAIRLTNLTLTPIFTDEAIYIRWSQIGARDAAWRFISLTDGKQPLFTWIMMVFLRILPGFDPLFVGRLVSVAAGLGSMIGLFVLGGELFGRKTGLVASFLYLICPFALVYDRMALYDSLVAMFAIWNLYIGIRLVKTLRTDTAYVFGMTLGAGMLNKTSGFFSAYLAPLTLVLFDWSRHGRGNRLIRLLGLFLLAGMLSQLMYSVLRLSPFFHLVGQKDAVFVYPFSEWLTHPFRFLTGNLKGLFDWVSHYLTIPIFTAAILAVFTLWRRPREKLLLYGMWLFPFVALALFGRVLYPRFILFMSMPLLLLAAEFLVTVWGKIRFAPWKMLLVLVIVGIPMWTDWYLLYDPLHAPIPLSDKGQYVDDWPSGWGVREANAFLLSESIKGPITVYTDGTFGLLPYAIEIYLVDRPNITIRGIWPLPPDMPPEMLEQAQKEPTYFVLNQEQVVPLKWPLTLIAQYTKGTRVDKKLRLLQVNPHPAQPKLSK